jgi:hypothetical protein
MYRTIPKGSRTLKLSELQDRLHMKVAPASFTPRRHPWYSFLLRVHTRATAAGKMKSVKNPSKPHDAATFWPVAQFLNQLRHRVPHGECIQKYIAVVYRNDTELCMGCKCRFFFCKNCRRAVHCRRLLNVSVGYIIGRQKYSNMCYLNAKFKVAHRDNLESLSGNSAHGSGGRVG